MPLVLSDPRSADDERDMIDRAVRALAEGKLVAFPTETVYGIAADASQEAAVARLLQIKGRRPGQPLTLAVKSVAAAFDYCPDVSPVGRRLGRRCWPGPLTLVLNGSHLEGQLGRFAPRVRQAVAPADFVGLRVPDHRFLLETLQRLPAPVTLTSANRSGQPDAVSAEEVVEALGTTSTWCSATAAAGTLSRLPSSGFRAVKWRFSVRACSANRPSGVLPA